MSEPFLAEIRLYGFNFAPRSYALCDGQILPINQNQSLYSLLGTTYGGDGRTTFQLPDLRSRTPIHKGPGNNLGHKAGAENVTLTTAQIPAHAHTPSGTPDAPTLPSPEDNLFSAPATGTRYAPLSGSDNMRNTSGSAVVTNTGGGQEHNNMQPYLTVSFCIAIQGLFPSRN